MPGLQVGGPFFQPPPEPTPPEGEVPGWATAEAGYPGATVPEEPPTEPEQPAEPTAAADAGDSVGPASGEVSG